MVEEVEHSPVQIVTTENIKEKRSDVTIWREEWHCDVRGKRGRVLWDTSAGLARLASKYLGSTTKHHRAKTLIKYTFTLTNI